MSDIEISDSDDSYHPEEDMGDSDSEDYTSMESDIHESDDKSFLSLGGGWSRVDVFADKRPNPVPPLRQAYSGVNPNLGINSDSSVIECVKKFITGDIVAHIVECSNECAKHFFEENPELNENVNKRMPSTRLDTFREKFLVPMMGNVDPGKNIAIDEALVLWKGRLGFRQLIKTKRARFGIKVFVMCNSEKEWSGYCNNFQIYYGKETSDSYVLPNVPGADELSISEKIVVHLANSVLGQGRHIFVDSWYSSIRLAHFLLTQEILMTGTIRPNRGVPDELRGEKLINQQASFVRKDNTLIVKWSDKREVYVISTCYESTLFVEKQQMLPGGRKISFKKPHMIEKYNDFMGGVDKEDQLLEPIDPSRKSLAWFKKLGLHFIMLLMLDSFLLHKNKVNKKSTIKRFIL
ncbi:piggyBac transposable element-derived protein 4-like [Palaemon carinicauda]|uniref:piggyBac transposable element-derived protein 4-like n=1 Tax=Palaemon carinicauda TaxID=392227 RepID=UPI0035B63AB2